MDLRQRDPFERKFAELIIRFRSIGFLLVLILVGLNGVTKNQLFAGYFSEISQLYKNHSCRRPQVANILGAQDLLTSLRS